MNRINTRKRANRERPNLKQIKILIISIALIVLSLFIYLYYGFNLYLNHIFENEAIEFSVLNKNIPFEVNKIILFSSATATSTNINQSLLDLNISQYCDIGIYLNNFDKENTIISSLYIDNIEISKPALRYTFTNKKKYTRFWKM